MKSQVLSSLWAMIACMITHGKQLPDNQEYISIDVQNQSKTHVIQDIQPIQFDEMEVKCPSAEDIIPCICTYDTRANAMDLDCSAVESEEQLKLIFQSNFPVKNFQNFDITHNKHLKVLESYVFNEISFERINVAFSEFEIIEMHALDSCYESAYELYFCLNKISSFPFDALSHFSKLEDFHIYANSLNIIPADAFHGLTTLVYLGLGFNTPNIVGTFENLPNLRTITLAGSDLINIPTNFIKTGNSNLWLISLIGNNISSVEQNAFESVENLEINMSLNSLATLEEVTWRPLLEGGVRLAAGNNPLVCGCDAAWLFGKDNLVKQIGEGTTCNDGQYLHDLDPSIFNDCKVITLLALGSEFTTSSHGQDIHDLDPNIFYSF